MMIRRLADQTEQTTNEIGRHEKASDGARGATCRPALAWGEDRSLAGETQQQQSAYVQGSREMSNPLVAMSHLRIRALSQRDA
jgi:hypothetical protein